MQRMYTSRFENVELAGKIPSFRTKTKIKIIMTITTTNNHGNKVNNCFIDPGRNISLYKELRSISDTSAAKIVDIIEGSCIPL